VLNVFLLAYHPDTWLSAYHDVDGKGRRAEQAELIVVTPQPPTIAVLR
jgi:hypothetical protein